MPIKTDNERVIVGPCIAGKTVFITNGTKLPISVEPHPDWDIEDMGGGNFRCTPRQKERAKNSP